MTKVFLDTDVILDLLLKREPFDEDAAAIFAKSEYGRLQLHTSTISFLNIHYICGRIVGALNLVSELRNLIVLPGVSPPMVDTVLAGDSEELEDAVQLSCAKSHAMDVLVTRNVEDFPKEQTPIMEPLAFLRFLSIRFEKRRRELEEMVREPEGPYYTDDSRVATEIVEDPDGYHSVGAFMVPEVSTWECILAHAQDDDIKVKIDDALEALERAYPEQLRGLLPRIFAGSNMDVENLRGLINLFSKQIFAEEHNGADLIGRVYEYFIGEFASSEGKRGGEYFTPESIVNCLVKMIEPTGGIVIDPCCGSGVERRIETNRWSGCRPSTEERLTFEAR